mmetsp:Transcript_9176/g.13784  ORF Transcript_9176/g.13784 Transcript_9176/m.13784 type:complete len:212 (-) Transcript_9176:37-672(-)
MKRSKINELETPKSITLRSSDLDALKKIVRDKLNSYISSEFVDDARACYIFDEWEKSIIKKVESNVTLIDDESESKKISILNEILLKGTKIDAIKTSLKLKRAKLCEIAIEKAKMEMNEDQSQARLNIGTQSQDIKVSTDEINMTKEKLTSISLGLFKIYESVKTLPNHIEEQIKSMSQSVENIERAIESNNNSIEQSIKNTCSKNEHASQ